MKNHRFPWLRNRTTDNRKCEKARNIKEKRTIEMFNQVSKQLVEHHSSLNVNLEQSGSEKDEVFRVHFQKYKPQKPCVSGVFCLFILKEPQFPHIIKDNV